MLNRCYLPGECEGVITDYVVGITSPDDCLNLCKTSDECQWWNFNGGSSACILSSSCLLVDNACTDCVYGQKPCGKIRKILIIVFIQCG